MPLGLIGPDSFDDVAVRSTTPTSPLSATRPDNDNDNTSRPMGRNTRPLGPISAESKSPTVRRFIGGDANFIVGPPIGLINLDDEGDENPSDHTKLSDCSFAPSGLLEDVSMADISDMEQQIAQQEATMEGTPPCEPRLFSFTELNEGSSYGDITSPRLSPSPALSCWCSTAVPDLIQIRRRWVEERAWLCDVRKEIGQAEQMAMQWPLSVLVGVPANWEAYDDIIFAARYSVVDLWTAWAEEADISSL